MNTSVSILIPTHNRAQVLGQTLASLAELSVPAKSHIELVIVANACTDSTESVVRDMLLQLPFPARYVTEPKANLNIARNVAVKHSRNDIVALIDDDVWVEKYWLESIIDAFSDPSVNIVAGRIELWWKDVARPSWFIPTFDSLLTCKDFGNEPLQLTSAFQPAGANLSFRRTIFDTIGPFVEGLDRTGANVGLSCGEAEFLQRAIAAEFKIHYFPRVALKHWVAPQRISPEYLQRVAFANAASYTMIKPRFGAYAVVRTAFGNSALYLWNSLRAVYYRIAGDRQELTYSQVQIARARGANYGLWMRLLRKSPVA